MNISKYIYLLWQTFAFLGCYLLVSILVPLNSYAETSSFPVPLKTSEKLSALESSKDTKKLTLNLGLKYTSNLRKTSSPDSDEFMTMQIEPQYNFSQDSNLNFSIDLVQKFNSEKKSGVSNTLVVYTPTKIDLSNQVFFEPKISLTLPTDETFREDQSYEGSVSLRPTLQYSPSKLRGWALGNVLYLNKNFHKYEIQNDYSPNTEYSMRERISISYQFNKWSVELLNDYVRSWTYGGYSHEAFYFAQSLAYEVTKNLFFNVDHMNEGSIHGPNYGPNSGESVEIFNEKTSYVSMGVGYVF